MSDPVLDVMTHHEFTRRWNELYDWVGDLIEQGRAAAQARKDAEAATARRHRELLDAIGKLTDAIRDSNREAARR
jgi:hypothetical protein